MYISSMIAVQYWFDKGRAVATGFVLTGVGFGTFIMSYTLHALINSIGLQNTFCAQVIFSSMVGNSSGKREFGKDKMNQFTAQTTIC